jgi:glutathione S-transferase
MSSKSALTEVAPSTEHRAGVNTPRLEHLDDRRGVARARRTLDDALARLEAEIGPSGYLVGDHFTVADLAVAAVMTAIVRPPEFPYPLPDPWPAELLELRESVADHPAVRWVLDVYRRNRGTSAEVAFAAPDGAALTLPS